jgi:hypothetical protein
VKAKAFKKEVNVYSPDILNLKVWGGGSRAIIGLFSQ